MFERRPERRSSAPADGRTGSKFIACILSCQAIAGIAVGVGKYTTQGELTAQNSLAERLVGRRADRREAATSGRQQALSLSAHTHLHVYFWKSHKSVCVCVMKRITIVVLSWLRKTSTCCYIGSLARFSSCERPSNKASR